jgi:hypothetical protein
MTHSILTHTHRVVVVSSDEAGFHGASGVYETKAEAQAQLLDIARSWVGLVAPELRADGSIVISRPERTLTYSVLTERASA